MGTRFDTGLFRRLLSVAGAFFSALSRFFSPAGGAGKSRLDPAGSDRPAPALAAPLPGGRPEAEPEPIAPPALLPGADIPGADFPEADGRGSETEWLLAADQPDFPPRGAASVLRLSLDPEQGADGRLPAPLRLFSRIIVDAVAKGASHVLIKPLEKSLEVSYLIDGVLIPKMHPSLEMRDRIVREIKALSSLDTGLSRVPQAGSVKLVTDLWERYCAVRVLPTRQGEQIGLSLTEKILH